MFKKIKSFFHELYAFFIFMFKLSLAIINYSFLLLIKVISFLFYKFRFSITFKLNLFYGFLYSLLSCLTYFITRFVMMKLSPSDQLQVLLTHYSLLTFTLMPIFLILFLVLGKVIVSKVLKPLKDMTTAVQTINGNDLVTRLDTHLAKDELKDLAITFNQMMDRLQVFVESQKQFASDASHELRTPIAIIQGYSDMLVRWGKDDPQILEESIQSIAQETRAMKILLEKLLFLSRSDKNTLKLDFISLDLSALCKEVLKETSFIDDEHTLTSKITDGIVLKADQGLIKELLRILIDNALKYTPEGGEIILSCTSTKQNIIVSIKDTGIGISKEHLPHLFERFYRVDEARNKKTGGTGLGLAIAKQICEAHKAQIFAHSQVGEGSEFVIFFPL